MSLAILKARIPSNWWPVCYTAIDKNRLGNATPFRKMCTVFSIP